MCGLIRVTAEWQVLRSIAGKDIIDVQDRGLNVGGRKIELLEIFSGLDWIL